MNDLTQIKILNGNFRRPKTLELIKVGLDNVGIKAFTIDFELGQVCLLSSNTISNIEIECILGKAGLTCQCFSECQAKTHQHTFINNSK